MAGLIRAGIGAERGLLYSKFYNNGKTYMQSAASEFVPGRVMPRSINTAHGMRDAFIFSFDGVDKVTGIPKVFEIERDEFDVSNGGPVSFGYFSAGGGILWLCS